MIMKHKNCDKEFNVDHNQDYRKVSEHFKISIEVLAVSLNEHKRLKNVLSVHSFGKI